MQNKSKRITYDAITGMDVHIYDIVVNIRHIYNYVFGNLQHPANEGYQVSECESSVLLKFIKI